MIKISLGTKNRRGLPPIKKDVKEKKEEKKQRQSVSELK